MNQTITNLLKPGITLSQKAVKGTFWVSAFKFADAILGFIKKIILARLLAPSDFGLFGLACLVMSMLETFTQTGVGAALIQKKDKTEEYLDVAWTINLIRGIILSILLYFFSPLIAAFFKNNEVIPFVRIISIIVLLNGLKNIGTIYFSKELDFRKQFVLNFGSSLAGFFVVVVLAFILKNAWALAWGMLAGAISECIISYLIHSHRPKLRMHMDKIKELTGFGKWVSASSILIFLLTQGDDIFVGKILGLTALGFYQMAYGISNLPATHITHVISQMTFPLYSKLQNDIPRLRKIYLKILELTAFLSFLTSGLIFSLAFDLTKIFLGEKWISIVPSLQVLCFFGIGRSIAATGGPIIFALGKPKIQASISFIQLIILAIIIYPLSFKFGILGTSIAVVVSFFIVFIQGQIINCRLINLPFRTFVQSLIPPAIITFLMVFMIEYVRSHYFLQNNNYQLFFSIVIGILFYLFSVLLFKKQTFLEFKALLKSAV